MNADLEMLRCPACVGPLQCDAAADALTCPACAEMFPVVNQIPRMLLSPLREALNAHAGSNGVESKQVATAESFGFEWEHFDQMYQEWEHNFLGYMGPHQADFFQGKRILDAGCGSGRHTYYAAKYGAEVWAVDIGSAIEVAQRNVGHFGAAHVAQADVFNLPFEPESFDMVYSLGVLHHLSDPEGAFRNLLRYVKPGGELRIYLYWKPEGQPIKGALLDLVSVFRQVTTRLPHRVLYPLSYPAAWAAWAGFVWPYQVLKRVPGLQPLAEKLPLKQYADYPFRVCVNDQFDRFSAPIENRYKRSEVEAWFMRAGLEAIDVHANFGWVGSGIKPVT